MANEVQQALKYIKDYKGLNELFSNHALLNACLNDLAHDYPRERRQIMMAMEAGLGERLSKAAESENIDKQALYRNLNSWLEEETGLAKASCQQILSAFFEVLEWQKTEEITVVIQEEEKNRGDQEHICGYDITFEEMAQTNFQRLIEIANQNNPQAQFELGKFYSRKEEYAKAAKWYEKAAINGYVQAQYILGDMYEKGCGVEENYEKSVEWYQKASDAGHADAQNDLGWMYINGYGVEQDYKKALSLFRSAAKQGHAKAHRHIGVMYDNGLGVSKDHVEAAKWYKIAAEKNNPTAQAFLGDMYLKGEGVEQNDVFAYQWSKRAADQGSAQGQTNLGWMYECGRCVQKNYIEALKWYLKAANQDHAGAQWKVGEFYLCGRGVSKNYSKALEWTLKAAEQDNSHAQHNMGSMYRDGDGVSQNYTNAAEWYQKAANQGEISSFLELAKLYEKGLGVAKDIAKAIEYYEKAAEQFSEAKEAIQRLRGTSKGNETYPDVKEAITSSSETVSLADKLKAAHKTKKEYKLETEKKAKEAAERKEAAHEAARKSIVQQIIKEIETACMDATSRAKLKAHIDFSLQYKIVTGTGWDDYIYRSLTKKNGLQQVRDAVLQHIITEGFSDHAVNIIQDKGDSYLVVNVAWQNKKLMLWDRGSGGKKITITSNPIIWEKDWNK